ncbi:MAG: hypothetical protein JWO31_2282 [Phycisphaerales bacterium]|nr:hypothetical protein [Phycisphaerales bacterium]
MTPPDSPAARIYPPQPFVVALAAWAVPGFGYALVGQRTRGVIVGITVVLLFVAGLLIGGIRSLEVPMAKREEVQVRELERGGVPDPREPRMAFGDEVRGKPWSIAQFFNGPIAFVAGYFSVRAGTVDPSTRQTPGVESHARVNEIAVLYTAVAGMLNLLAIIDSAHRAGRLLETP